MAWVLPLFGSKSDSALCRTLAAGLKNMVSLSTEFRPALLRGQLLGTYWNEKNVMLLLRTIPIDLPALVWVVLDHYVSSGTGKNI